MADIFISYARSTEPHARIVGDLLRQAGHAVWRDDELPAHRAYSEVIEERLREAKAVVVLWSAEAVKSQWVRAEADVAREAGTMVQMSVDGVVPPIPFNQIQCADLNGWSGDPEHPGWKKILDSVASLTGPVAPVAAASPAAAAGKSDNRMRLIVLPFENMSGDAEQAYFSDGISEDIITDLSKVSALDVVARNTAFHFKGQQVDVEQLARDLGVSHVVEGSVRKAEGRVRITAQLIDGTNGNQIWAERYDRDFKDIFALQDEISKAIVAALRLKLLPKEKKAIEHRGTTSSDAYNLYLMARQHWFNSNEGDPRPLEIVVRICRQAVAIDADYAKAWGLMGLAQVYLMATFSKDVDANPAADRALEIDPDLPEALCAKALMASFGEDHDTAKALMDRALEVDPESFEVNKMAARIFFRHGQYREAIPFYEKAAELAEHDYHGPGMLTTCYRAVGDQEKLTAVSKMLVERCKKALEKDPGDAAALAMGTAGLAEMGDRDRVIEWIDRALLVDPDNLIMRYNLGCTLSNTLEEHERALEVLEDFFARIGPESLQHCDADPDMNKLRDHPRFKELMAAAKARTGVAAKAG
ncbi:TIR domain-containing protein [Sphingomicrobium nitratireducens]|uniref:TIR domain-containing protein n=1 Tax=Sphingomicrobium nitratireducens TaxID=2964666 RepID=UPI0022409D3D|nr:TIR domain-containing protein [Sphingomicrobium nitratireducens]